MAGTRLAIKARWEGERLERALRRLQRAAGDLEPALHDFGESWLNNTRARFEAEQAPDGTPWAPLSERYKRRKTKNRDKVLTLSGELMRQLNYQVSGHSVAVGSPLEYAAVHQFGATKGAFGATRLQ
jgi:phage virion morphogenesis protein